MLLVQAKPYGSPAPAASHDCVLDDPPTQGNLLLAVAFIAGEMTSNSWGATADAAVLGDERLLVLSKIAGASEPDTFTVIPNFSTSVCIHLYEYELPTASPFDVAAVNNSDTNPGGSPQVQLPTGSTVATAQAIELAVAAFGVKLGAGALGSITNGFTVVLNSTTAGDPGTDRRLVTALKELSAIGAVSSQATATNPASTMLALVSTYKMQAGGGGGGANRAAAQHHYDQMQ